MYIHRERQHDYPVLEDEDALTPLSAWINSKLFISVSLNGFLARKFYQIKESLLIGVLVVGVPIKKGWHDIDMTWHPAANTNF